MAYLKQIKIRGKMRYILIWYDYRKGKGSKARNQITCDSRGWSNQRSRQEALKLFQEKEDTSKDEVDRYGTSNEDPRFLLIFETIDEFIKKRRNLVKLRKTRGGRHGISKSTFDINSYAMCMFTEFCEINEITICKDVTPKIALDFRYWLEVKKFQKVTSPSTFTLNKILRNIKAFFNNYKLDDPSRFDQIEKIVGQLKPFTVETELGFHFKSINLQTILSEALIHDCEQCKITRKKAKQGKDFSDDLPLKRAPLFPNIVLIMMTGMRLNEALTLTWDKYDSEFGTIKIEKAFKTGRSRLVPLISKSQAVAVVSPGLNKLLKVWQKMAGDEYVLPHQSILKPVRVKKPLEEFKKLTGINKLTFQNLRKNFISYSVSSGVPPAIVAFWVGHSTAVSDKHYVSYVFGDLTDNSIEKSMGVEKILIEAYNGFLGKGKYKNLKLMKWC